MAKKKRSEIYAKKSKASNTNKKKKKIQNKNIRLIKLLLSILLLISPLFLYEKVYNTPQRSIKNAVESIKTLDTKKQDKYFDKMGEFISELGESYSNNTTQKKEFLRANFSNLKVDIKKIQKSKNGLLLDVDVTNVSYIEVFDKLNEEKDFHNQYIRDLSNENQDRHTIQSTLILKKHLSYYEIYESKDFVDGCLGGSFKYVDKNKNK